MRRLRSLSAVVLVAIACLIVVPGTALAKSYEVDRVVVDATVAEDGSLTVVEQRTMSFDGSFSEVHWTLDKSGSSGIEILGVEAEGVGALAPAQDPGARDSRPENTYQVTDTGSAVEVYAFHRTADRARTFTLTYRALGAAARWQDTSELYWMLLGEGWDVPAGEFRATVRMPGGLSKADVRAWAYGPLTGVIRIGDDGVVTLSVDDVPANTLIGVRTLFPVESLPAATNVNPEARVQAALDYEGQRAEEANALRREARTTVWFWTGLALLLSIGGVALAAWAFFRHGREYKPEFAGRYFREDPRPDLPPAVIGALMRFGKVDDSDIGATLMDLADKGVITMAPAKVDRGGLRGLFGSQEDTFTLQLTAEKYAELAPLDRKLLDILFKDVAGGRGSFNLTEIETYAKAHPETFTSDVKGWKDMASGMAEAEGFFEPDAKSWQILIFILAVVVGVVGSWGSGSTGSPIPAVAGFIAALTMAVFGLFMNRRSRQGNELYRTYAAVKDFLNDFSRLEEAPPQSIVLWNRFLVLAVVFGIADRVIEQLRVTMPEVLSDPGFQTSYWWVYAGAYGHSPVSVVSQSFVSAASVASSEMSSAAGGGGGFSGGGGFGGGGGGGGGAS